MTWSSNESFWEESLIKRTLAVLSSSWKLIRASPISVTSYPAYWYPFPLLKELLKINIHSIINILDLMSLTTKSMPSSSPSPVIALQAIICQWRPSEAIVSKSRTSLISLGVRAPAMSYLLQKTRRVAPANFSWVRSFWSSLRQSSRRSLSPLSTTQIKPSVCSK